MMILNVDLSVLCRLVHVKIGTEYFTAKNQATHIDLPGYSNRTVFVRCASLHVDIKFIAIIIISLLQ